MKQWNLNEGPFVLDKLSLDCKRTKRSSVYCFSFIYPSYCIHCKQFFAFAFTKCLRRGFRSKFEHLLSKKWDKLLSISILYSWHRLINSTKISGNFGLKMNGSVRSNQESFEKNWPTFRGGPLFSVGPVRSKRTVQPILNSRTSLFGIFHAQNGGKYLSLHFYGLLTADLLVLLVHSCEVTTGL